MCELFGMSSYSDGDAVFMHGQWSWWPASP
jgi:hypothetical protein